MFDRFFLLKHLELLFSYYSITIKFFFLDRTSLSTIDYLVCRHRSCSLQWESGTSLRKTRFRVRKEKLMSHMATWRPDLIQYWKRIAKGWNYKKDWVHRFLIVSIWLLLILTSSPGGFFFPQQTEWADAMCVLSVPNNTYRRNLVE